MNAEEMNAAVPYAEYYGDNAQCPGDTVAGSTRINYDGARFPICCRRCAGLTKRGTQCTRRVCFGLPYCFQHTQSILHLKVAESRHLADLGIRGQGGLYAWAGNRAGPDEVVFHEGQVIVGMNLTAIERPRVEYPVVYRPSVGVYENFDPGVDDPRDVTNVEFPGRIGGRDDEDDQPPDDIPNLENQASPLVSTRVMGRRGRPLDPYALAAHGDEWTTQLRVRGVASFMNHTDHNPNARMYSAITADTENRDDGFVWRNETINPYVYVRAERDIRHGEEILLAYYQYDRQGNPIPYDPDGFAQVTYAPRKRYAPRNPRNRPRNPRNRQRNPRNRPRQRNRRNQGGRNVLI